MDALESSGQVIEDKLGRAFRETEPFALYPLDEYFSSTIRGGACHALHAAGYAGPAKRSCGPRCVKLREPYATSIPSPKGIHHDGAGGSRTCPSRAFSAYCAARHSKGLGEASEVSQGDG